MNIKQLANIKEVIEKLNKDEYITLDEVNKAIALINEEINVLSDKAVGRKANIRSALKKFLGKDSARPALQHANKFESNGKTYYAYLDGFKMAWSTEDFGYGVNDEISAIKVNQIIKSFCNPIVLNITDELKTDVYKAVKLWDKMTPYILHLDDERKVYLNPDYLKSAIDFTSADCIELDGDAFGYYGYNAPIYLHNSETDRHALVLPIRR